MLLLAWSGHGYTHTPRRNESPTHQSIHLHTPTGTHPQIHDELDALVDPMLFVGRAPEQVDEFITEEIDPVLKRHAALLAVENKDGVSV